MKKLLLTDLFASFSVLLVLLLMPWTANLAESGCNGIMFKTFCNNSTTLKKSHINENIAREVVPTVFPYEDLIIRI